MGTHGSYLTSVGQIRPTEITFISVCFNSRPRKFPNFRVHTYPPTEATFFPIDHAATRSSCPRFNLKWSFCSSSCYCPPAFSSRRHPPAPCTTTLLLLVSHQSSPPTRRCPTRRPHPPVWRPTRWPHPPAVALLDGPAYLSVPHLPMWHPTRACHPFARCPVLLRPMPVVPPQL
jgi:hypothetical protein